MGRDKTTPYTIEQVREHQKRDDCWIVIDNKVLNVTGWIDKHPGGSRTIMNLAGRDATDPFTAFHPDETWKMLGAYQIGTLVDYEPSEFVKAYRALRQEIVDEGLFKISHSYFLIKYAWIYGMWVLGIALTVFGVGDLRLQLLGSFFVGWSWNQGNFIGHDTGHNYVWKEGWTNQLCALFLGNPHLGVSTGWWKSTHNCHHIITNSIDYDPDIQHLPVFSISQSFFGNIFSKYHNRVFEYDRVAKALVPFQHWLFLPIMSVARFNLQLQSFIWVMKDKDSQYRYSELTGIVTFWIWFSWVLSYLPSWWVVGLWVYISYAIAGIVHVQITISHFPMETYMGPGYLNDDQDWFRMQCATTMDVDCPEWADWFHGGLQFQLEHHLYPRVPRHNLRKIRSKIIPFCQKWNIPRYESPWLEANRLTINTLKSTANVAAELFHVASLG